MEVSWQGVKSGENFFGLNKCQTELRPLAISPRPRINIWPLFGHITPYESPLAIYCTPTIVKIR